MSRFLARIWNTMSKRGHLVGRDLEGNSFYESIVPRDDRRTRRTVEYNRSGETWESASGISRLPAQWISWLSHTRHEAPTLEELQKDRERQDKLALNVAHLKQQEVRRRSNAIRTPVIPMSILVPVESSSSPPAVPQSKPIGPTAEPQSWAPRLTRRG